MRPRPSSLGLTLKGTDGHSHLKDIDTVRPLRITAPPPPLRI